MERDRQIFFCHFELFLPFYPLTIQKIKILKKWKKMVGDNIIYTNVPKIMIICYTVYEIRCVRDMIFVSHFRLFFALLPPNNQKNQNFRKMIKHLEISSFPTCVPKIMITWCLVPETWSPTDGRIDVRTDGKSDIWRWVPDLKNIACWIFYFYSRSTSNVFT